MRIQIVLTEALSELHKSRFRAMLRGINKVEKTEAISFANGEGNITSVKKVMADSKADLIVFFGNEIGRFLGMKAAAELKYTCFTDVLDIENGRIHKKVYNTHAEGYFKIPKGKVVVILLPGGPCIDEPDNRIDCIVPELYGCEKVNSDIPEVLNVVEKNNSWGLDSAKIVFIGGRGLKKKENFQLLVDAGNKWGASVGCTRAAALAGWSDYSRVVGVSGSQIRPEICVLFGVSGAAPFLFGIQNAKTVIAINKDSNAPIFDAADYGVVKDCIPVLKGILEVE